MIRLIIHGKGIRIHQRGCTGGMFTNVQAIKNLMKQYNSDGEYVNPIPSGELDGVTRESVESQLAKSGNTFVKKASSGGTLDIKI